MSLFLCIDCGGTKAAACILDARGNVVGRGSGGPSNFKDVDYHSFLAAVRTAAESALAAANHLPSFPMLEPKSTNTFASWFKHSKSNGSLKLSHHRSRSSTSSLASHTSAIRLPTPVPLFKAAWIGVSGIDREQDVIDLTPVFSDLFSIPPGPNLIISNDTHLLASPLGLHPNVNTAVVAISGTGCIVVSFTEDEHSGALHQLGRAGGWGWLLGDEGSGFDIGREAIRRILAKADHESCTPLPSPTSTPPTTSKTPGSPGASTPPPSLQDRMFEHFGITAAADFFTVVYAPDPPRTPLSPPSSPLSSRRRASSRPASPASQRSQSTPAYLAQERKARITSLTPIVFKSAFTDQDPLALSIVRTSATHLARLISQNLEPRVSGGPSADDSVLCFGGSLVGIREYRELVLGILRDEMGITFPHVDFVGDAALSGAQRLVAMAGGPATSVPEDIIIKLNGHATNGHPANGHPAHM